MRVVDTKPARGSLHWIRRAVNHHPDLLNQQIVSASGLPLSTAIEWLSPLASDDFAEYRDRSFLERLGVQLEQEPLAGFWPKFGPQWDGLARTGDGQVLLIEAKANIAEIVSPGTGASAASRALIEKSLRATQGFLGVDPAISWSGKLYQYANRLAHLYLLRELNDIPAWLVFVYFINDTDTNGPSSEAEWNSALTVVKGVLGLGRNRLSKYVVNVFLDIRNLKA